MSEWIPISNPPTKPGMYLIFAPSADPEKPHRSTAWYEPEGTGNDPGWQLLDVVITAWWSYGNSCPITHWAEWPGDPKENPE